MWVVCSSAFCEGWFYLERRDTDRQADRLMYADREVLPGSMRILTMRDTDKYFTRAHAEILCDQLNVRDYGRVA